MSQQDLLEQFAIAQVAYRYANAVDKRDAAALADCFDTEYRGIGPGYEMRGKGADIAQQITTVIAQMYLWTMHNVHNTDYVVSGDTATGTTNCVASHVSVKDGTHIKLDWYIKYTDKLVKRDGKWRFSERSLHTRFTTTQMVQPLDPA
jgi:ketosteroid isomerase-like protein